MISRWTMQTRLKMKLIRFQRLAELSLIFLLTQLLRILKEQSSTNCPKYTRCLAQTSSLNRRSNLSKRSWVITRRRKLSRILQSTILRKTTVRISAMYSQVCGQLKWKSCLISFSVCSQLEIRILTSRQGKEVKYKVHASFHLSHLPEKIQSRKKANVPTRFPSKALLITLAILNHMKHQG